MAEECPHMNFNANVAVARLEDSGRFNAEVQICCCDCGRQFQFIGLPLGLNLNGPSMSVDGLEARLAIAPLGSIPQPLDSALLQGFRIAIPGKDH